MFKCIINKRNTQIRVFNIVETSDKRLLLLSLKSGLQLRLGLGLRQKSSSKQVKGAGWAGESHSVTHPLTHSVTHPLTHSLTVPRIGRRRNSCLWRSRRRTLAPTACSC